MPGMRLARVSVALRLLVSSPRRPSSPGLAAWRRHRRRLRHASGVGTASAQAVGPTFFNTVTPGKKLPSGAQCATWVRSRPMKENKGVNRKYNHTRGQHIGKNFFSGDKPQANKLIAPRVNGNFTGTTAEILRWAACKWGINQNIVFAQAAVESWWRQTTKGDWETNGCPPGHGPGVDGMAGQCPQSWGILQNRYPFETVELARDHEVDGDERRPGLRASGAPASTATRPG